MSENFIIGSHWSANRRRSSRTDDSPLNQNSSNRLNSLAHIKLSSRSLSPSVLLCFRQAQCPRGLSWASVQGEEKPVASWKSLRISPDWISLCPTLCHPMECSPPGSFVHGILQARILEWEAISSSRDLPNPGIEPASPVSPALSGRVFTTVSPVPAPTKHCSQENRMRVCLARPGFLKENVHVPLPKDRRVKTSDTYYNFQCLSGSEILFAIGAICREEA